MPLMLISIALGGKRLRRKGGRRRKEEGKRKGEGGNLSLSGRGCMKMLSVNMRVLTKSLRKWSMLSCSLVDGLRMVMRAVHVAVPMLMLMMLSVFLWVQARREMKAWKPVTGATLKISKSALVGLQFC